MEKRVVGAALVDGMTPLAGMLGEMIQLQQGACDDCPLDSCVPSSNGSVTQWATNDGEIYYAVGRTVTAFPPNAYEIGEIRGQIMFRKIDIDVTGLLRLPDTVSDQVLAEIEKFWDRADRFVKYKITQRRGILIAGPSGCGKTCTSKLVCVNVVQRGGVVIPYTDPRLLIHGLALFRSIQPDTPIVVPMEDIDEIAAGDSSTFLNMLDGIYAQFKRVVFVATTNYPERLERRVTNRPSRFDCVITMDHPNLAARQMYLDALAADVDPAIFDKTKAAGDTEKLGFSHLKELFTSVAILDIPYTTALEKIRRMAEEELPTGDELEFGGNGHMGLLSQDESLPRPRRRMRR